MSRCNCNFWTEDGTGGVTCGGSSTVEVIGVSGGVTCAGSASVDIIGDTYDGLVGLWPLDETGAGVADEYKDRTRNNFDGTGGGGNILYVPDVTSGVFCLPAADFDGMTGLLHLGPSLLDIAS